MKKKVCLQTIVLIWIQKHANFSQPSLNVLLSLYYLKYFFLGTRFLLGQNGGKIIEEIYERFSEKITPF